MKFATLIVTFNRKKELIKNIMSQLSQVMLPNYILIVDNNSTDGTYETLKKNGFLDNKIIIYYNTRDNLGGAGGFSYGIEKSLKLDIDYIILMDDDGYYYDEYGIYNLVKSIDTTKKLIFHNSVVTYDSMNLSFPFSKKLSTNVQKLKMEYNNIIHEYASPFNSTMLSIELIKKIGLPNKEFFIKGDEVEYLQRAKESGAYVTTALNSIYIHPTMKKNHSISKVPFIKLYYPLEAPWKEYYSIRNQTYVMLKYSKLAAYRNYFKKKLKSYILKYDYDVKLLRKEIKRGFKDGKKGILGKDKKRL